MSRGAGAALFLLALVLRALYALVVWDGPASIRQPDTPAFERPAIALAEDLTIAMPTEDGGLKPFTERPPGYIVFLAGVHLLHLGDGGVLALQILADCVTVLVIGAAAGRLRTGLAVPAAAAAAVNPDQIIHCAVILSDSLALLPFALFVWALLGALSQPTLRRVALAGALLGLAALVRPTPLYFVPVLPLLVALAGGNRRWIARVGAAVVALAASAAVLAPWYVRNGVVAGHYAYTDQSGVHALYWLVPLAKEYGAGVPYERGVAEMEARLRAELARQRLEGLPADTFVASALMGQVALGALREVPPAALLRAWVMGAFINAGAPALVASPLVQHLPRPSFYATPGDNAAAKVLNYLRDSQGGTFTAVLAVGFAIAALTWGLALAGLTAVLRCRLWAWRHGLALALLALYVFALTGPVVGVKYRLPVDPLIAFLVAEGVAVIVRRLPSRG